MTAPLYLSMFRHLRDTAPQGRPVEVGAVAQALGSFRVAATREERARSVPLWSPVEYLEGRSRASANVRRVHWLVLDYDDGTPIQVARQRWSGWVHIGHTSYSHMRGRPPSKAQPEGKPPAPALRVVLPLLEPVEAEVWPDVMRSILGDIGQEADRACIDPARMFYVPVVASEDAPRAHWVHMPAGGIDSPWICLADRVEAARRAKLERASEAAARREQARARARDVTESYRDRGQEIRRRLMEDPTARERLGEALGAVRVDRQSGAMMRGVSCPACARPSVWWVIDPSALRKARCNHRKSCGFEAHLWELAAVLEVGR
jgi:hypothetical protein